MSARVLELLRGELGFHGVIVSDDLEMKAVAEHFTIERAVIEGINAGVDLFLVCHDHRVQRGAIESLVKAVEKGQVKRERVNEALARVRALERRFVHGPEDLLATLGTAEHARLAAGLSVETFTGRDPTER
jgi:beta-N-acetylhexosaminidase